MAAAHDLYGELGVARDAKDDAIRSAYRKLVRRHHPDVNPGRPEAEELFKRAAAAYEVLSDKSKRAQYDALGEGAPKSTFDFGNARAYERYSAGRARSAPGDVPSDFDLTDIIDQERRKRAHGMDVPLDGADIVAEVPLDFATALSGTELDVEVPARSACEVCRGFGADPDSKPRQCDECEGTGRVNVLNGPMRMTSACAKCGGDGKLHKPCARCHGTGLTESTARTRVRIPKGAADGSELRVRGKGTPGLSGGATGDLVIRTRVADHPHFTRDGLDLRLSLPVTLAEAHFGARVPVPTPGGVVQLKIPERSQSGAQLRLRGNGVTRGSEVGDLYVQLSVQLPHGDSPELAEALQITSRYYPGDVRKEVRL